MVKFLRSAGSIIVCLALVVTSLPFYVSADNSGFGQIRIFYKTKDSLGNWSGEKSAIITDNSILEIGSNNMTTPIQITRFLVRNDSEDQSADIYFQFDICFGGLIPTSGQYPRVTYSSLAFTANGGVTAYSFAATDNSPFVIPSGVANSPYYHDVYDMINTSSSRTFFGRCSQSGYITFNNPVNITFSKGDSPSTFIYIFFRHLVIGIDNSSYIVNLENTLNNIDTNVNQIADWMEEEHNLFDDAWNSGASDVYDNNKPSQSDYDDLDSISGIGAFSSLWTFNIFSQFNSFFTDWFSQTTSDGINGTSSRSDPAPDYVDFMNLQDEIDFWKEATEYVGDD